MSGFWQVSKKVRIGTGIWQERWLSFGGSRSRPRITWRKYAGAHIAEEARARDLATKYGGTSVYVS